MKGQPNVLLHLMWRDQCMHGNYGNHLFQYITLDGAKSITFSSFTIMMNEFMADIFQKKIFQQIRKSIFSFLLGGKIVLCQR